MLDVSRVICIAGWIANKYQYRQPTIPSWMNQFHALYMSLLKIHFNNIFPCKSRSPSGSFLSFPHQNHVCTSLVTNICHKYHPTIHILRRMNCSSLHNILQPPNTSSLLCPISTLPIYPPVHTACFWFNITISLCSCFIE
jgi:hypothetical protein